MTTAILFARKLAVRGGRVLLHFSLFVLAAVGILAALLGVLYVVGWLLGGLVPVEYRIITSDGAPDRASTGMLAFMGLTLAAVTLALLLSGLSALIRGVRRAWEDARYEARRATKPGIHPGQRVRVGRLD